MTKNLKYYDLIITKIKAHRKYEGLENILDDIANDVCEHAKVIVNTVSNEDVINAYLDKIISTSIITVPKKLNINTRTDRPKLTFSDLVDTDKFVEETEEALEETKEEIFEETEEVLEEAEEEIFEETEEVLEEVEEEIFEEAEEVLEEAEEEILEETEEVLEETEEEVLEEAEEEVLEETEEEVLEEAEEEVLEETETQAVQDIDQTLVEKMINGVSVKNNTEENFDLAIKDDDNEILEFLDTDIEAIDTNDLLEDNFSEEIIDTIEEVTDFALPDYSCFNTPSQKINFEKDLIKEAITEIQKNYANISVTDICTLKFNDKKSVKEIANIINNDIEVILEILNDIAEYLKD